MALTGTKTYSDGVMVNYDIPYTMTELGLHYLGRLARTVPENGTIVEVGPLYGSSTWVLSKNAHPSVRIVSIDTWEPAEWISRRFPDIPFGIEAFRGYTQDCPNVEAVQGWSPAVVADTWSSTIDLFFDDATHGDPGFSENLAFFLPHLAPDGILCGDDYSPRWPDIVRLVNRAADERSADPEVMGRVWSLRNGHDRTGPSRPVAERVGAWTSADVRVTAHTPTRSYAAPPRAWAGRIRGAEPLTGLQIDIEGPVEGFFDVRLADGQVLENLAFGTAHDFGRSIVDFRARLEGPRDVTLRYRVCEILPRTARNPANGQPCVIPRGVRGHHWMVKESSDAPISALLLYTEPRSDRPA